MPDTSFSGSLPSLTVEEQGVSRHLHEYVVAVAHTIGERNIQHYDALKNAVRYINMTFRDNGYTVNTQDFHVEGKIVTNLEVELRGATPGHGTLRRPSHSSLRSFLRRFIAPGLLTTYDG